MTQPTEYFNAIFDHLSRIENTMLIIFLILIIINVINLMFNSIISAKYIIDCSSKKRTVASVRNNTFSLKTYKPIE